MKPPRDLIRKCNACCAHRGAQCGALRVSADSDSARFLVAVAALIEPDSLAMLAWHPFLMLAFYTRLPGMNRGSIQHGISCDMLALRLTHGRPLGSLRCPTTRPWQTAGTERLRDWCRSLSPPVRGAAVFCYALTWRLSAVGGLHVFEVLCPETTENP